MQSSEPRGLVQFSLYGNLSGVTLVHTSGLVWLKVICCDCSAVVFHMVKWECYNINGTLASLHLWVKTTRTLKIKSKQKKINTCICNFFWGGRGYTFQIRFCPAFLAFLHTCALCHHLFFISRTFQSWCKTIRERGLFEHVANAVIYKHRKLLTQGMCFQATNNQHRSERSHVQL